MVQQRTETEMETREKKTEEGSEKGKSLLSMFWCYRCHSPELALLHRMSSKQ